LKTEENVEVRWAYFPLHPETPVEGMSLAELFKGAEPTAREAFATQMKGLMNEAGLPYSKRSMTYNSRLAQELAAWADTQPGGDRLHSLLYQAYFVDNLNIGDTQVLIDLTERAGLSAEQAGNVLKNRLMSVRINEDWQRAWQGGITGVPTFWSQDLYVMGCQPYETLLRFVSHLRKLKAENQ